MTNKKELEELLKKSVIPDPPYPPNINVPLQCQKWLSTLPTLGNFQSDCVKAFKTGLLIPEMDNVPEIQKAKGNLYSLQILLDGWDVMGKTTYQSLISSGKYVFSIDSTGTKIVTNSNEYCQILKDHGFIVECFNIVQVMISEMKKPDLDPTPPVPGPTAWPDPTPGPPPPPPPTPDPSPIPSPSDAKRDAEKKFMEKFVQEVCYQTPQIINALCYNMIADATAQLSRLGVIYPQTPDTIYSIMFWTAMIPLAQRKKTE